MADGPFQVALGDVGSSTKNTLLLDRWDLVVPVERDLDDDPLVDDEVVLKDLDGQVVRRLLASDDDVSEDPDSGMLLYCFRDLPFGVYSVAVVVGAQEHPVIAQVVVRAKGVFIGETKLSESSALARLARAQEPADDAEADGATAGEFPRCG
jgi:hypothetical protein